jgi:hypothetical protein
MDSPPKTLKATLQTIRDLATSALNQIAESQEEQSTICDMKGDSDFFSDCFGRSPECESLTTPRTRWRARAYRSHCPLHRKRESARHVSNC